MKRAVIYFFPFTVILVIIYSFNSVSGDCDSPLIGAGHAADPGNPSCTGCHGGDDNTGIAGLSFTIGGGITTYKPDSTYTVFVNISQPGLDKFGFEITALNTSNNAAGINTLTDELRTRTTSEGTRDYVTSTPCGADALMPGNNNWSFDWTAPSAGAGDVTFYLAALAANHSHNTSGDSTYTKTQTISEKIATEIYDNKINDDIQIYPNPADEILIIQLQEAIYGEVELYNAAGENVYAVKVSATDNIIEINTYSLLEGIYFIKLKDTGKIITKKIIIQH